MKDFNSQMFILTLLNIPRVGRKVVNSLLACKNILEREGYEVICLAIAKTKKYN